MNTRNIFRDARDGELAGDFHIISTFIPATVSPFDYSAVLQENLKQTVFKPIPIPQQWYLSANYPETIRINTDNKTIYKVVEEIVLLLQK